MNTTIATLSNQADFAALAAAIDAAEWDAVNEIEKGTYTADSLRQFVTAPRTFLVVAMQGEKLAGLASATIQLHPHTESQWLYVDELDVAVPFRRKGVGSAIMKHLRDIATEQGCHELALGADAVNTPANALYARLRPDKVESVKWYSYDIQKKAHDNE